MPSHYLISEFLQQLFHHNWSISPYKNILGKISLEAIAMPYSDNSDLNINVDDIVFNLFNLKIDTDLFIVYPKKIYSVNYLDIVDDYVVSKIDTLSEHDLSALIDR